MITMIIVFNVMNNIIYKIIFVLKFKIEFKIVKYKLIIQHVNNVLMDIIFMKVNVLVVKFKIVSYITKVLIVVNVNKVLF